MLDLTNGFVVENAEHAWQETHHVFGPRRIINHQLKESSITVNLDRELFFLYLREFDLGVDGVAVLSVVKNAHCSGKNTTKIHTTHCHQCYPASLMLTPLKCTGRSEFNFLILQGALFYKSDPSLTRKHLFFRHRFFYNHYYVFVNVGG